MKTPLVAARGTVVGGSAAWWVQRSCQEAVTQSTRRCGCWEEGGSSKEEAGSWADLGYI